MYIPELRVTTRNSGHFETEVCCGKSRSTDPNAQSNVSINLMASTDCCHFADLNDHCLRLHLMMGSFDRFAWTEIRSGRWERDIDEIENFYLALDRQFAASGRHLFAIMGHVSVTLDVPADQHLENCEREFENTLREAWKRLRFDHPTIASWVEYDGSQPRKIYENGDTPTERVMYLDTWLESTFCPIHTEKTGLEWCNSDPPVPKLPTLFVLKTSEALVDGVARGVVRRDLVLRAPHDIIDGIGTLLLFSNFLTLASEAYDSADTHEELSWGEEAKNLSPSFRVAAALPDAISPEQLERIERITAENAALRKDIPVLSTPYDQTATMPGKHQRLSTTISSQLTSSILAACRAHSLSVTQAYHTAIAMVVRDIQPAQPTSSLKRYINYCLINERAHCKAPYDTPSHAAAVYHSTSGHHLGLDLTVAGTSDPPRTAADDKADFARLAPIVKDYYTSIRNDASHPPLVPHYFTMATPKDPRIKDSTANDPPPLPEPNGAPSVSISSMGRVDSLIKAQHGSISVHDPWVTGEELGTGLGAFLGTFRDELHLSAAYNEAFHGREEVERFLARVQEVVECVLEV